MEFPDFITGNFLEGKGKYNNKHRKNNEFQNLGQCVLFEKFEFMNFLEQIVIAEDHSK